MNILRKLLLPLVLLLLGTVSVAHANLSDLRAVALDSLGFVWLGNADGLYRWDGRNLSMQGVWDGYEGGAVNVISVDPQGRVWVQGAGGLFRRDVAFRRVESLSPVLEGKCRCMLANGGRLLIGGDRGLVSMDAQGRERVLLEKLRVNALCETSQGILMVGCQAQGIYLFDANGNPALIPPGFRETLPTIEALAADRERVLAAGLDIKGHRRCAEVDLERGQLRFLDLDVLPVTQQTQAPLLKYTSDDGFILHSAQGWLRLADRQLLRTQQEDPRQWPAEDLCAWLPELCQRPVPGGFHVKDNNDGVLLEVNGQVRLLLAANQQNLSVIQGLPGDTPVLLLEEESGERLLLEHTEEGYRRPLLPDSLNMRNLRTMCHAPGGSAGDLLVGLSEGLLLLREDQSSTLLSDEEVWWLEDFSPTLALASGPQGLAFFDGTNVSQLRVREPVYMAINDGFRGITACAARYMINLDAANEIDTLQYPETLIEQALAAELDPGQLVRQLLAVGGRYWLLAGDDFYYYASPQIGWCQLLPGAGLESATIRSVALDHNERVWLSGSMGNGYLVSDYVAPMIVADRQLQQLDRKQLGDTLPVDVVDPLSLPQAAVKIRCRLDDGEWSAWQRTARLVPAQVLPTDTLSKGIHRFQMQAVDAWGNLSPQLLTVPLNVTPRRIGITHRISILLGLLIVGGILTTILPGKISLLLLELAALGVSYWIWARTEEPYFYFLVPVFALLIWWYAQVNLKQARAREKEEPLGGLLELVDLFREFGHSGTATRNLDRLLRTSRNLYHQSELDTDVLERFLEARRLFLELTAHSLHSVTRMFDRLPERDNPLPPSQLALYRERVSAVEDCLNKLQDPPSEAAMEELAFHLNQLQNLLSELEHKVDLQISSAPLAVIDRILKERQEELAGVELVIVCARELRQVMARLPVEKLHFILDNLVTNAVYWMRGCKDARLTIELIERPTRLQILVRDTGPGIPAEQQERVFDAGWSGRSGSDENNTSEESGGGYGLYRSREILVRFSGRLVIHETSPEGTSFLLEVKKVEPA